MGPTAEATERMNVKMRKLLPVVLFLCSAQGAMHKAEHPLHRGESREYAGDAKAQVHNGAGSAGPGKNPLNLREAHSRADTDGDKHVAPKELVALLHHAWHYAAQTALHMLPPEKQAFFLMPFFESHTEVSLGQVSALGSNAHVEEFHLADSDSDSKVTLTELTAHLYTVAGMSNLAKYSRSALEADVANLFDTADSNGDGLLSLAELRETPHDKLGGNIHTLLRMGTKRN